MHVDVIDHLGNSCPGGTCPPPPHDECIDLAGVVTAMPAGLGLNHTDFACATASDPVDAQPDCPSGFGGVGSADDDLWFEFTSTCTAGQGRLFNFDLSPDPATPPLDRTLGLYDMCSLPGAPAPLITCDESFGGVSSNVTHLLAPGQSTIVRAGATGGGPAGSQGVLRIEYAIPCPADIASAAGGLGVTDCVVDGFDLLSLLSCWGPVTPGSLCALADLAGPSGPGPDGEVNGFDLLFMLGAWGDCP